MCSVTVYTKSRAIASIFILLCFFFFFIWFSVIGLNSCDQMSHKTRYIHAFHARDTISNSFITWRDTHICCVFCSSFLFLSNVRGRCLPFPFLCSVAFFSLSSSFCYQQLNIYNILPSSFSLKKQTAFNLVWVSMRCSARCIKAKKKQLMCDIKGKHFVPIVLPVFPLLNLHNFSGIFLRSLSPTS